MLMQKIVKSLIGTNKDFYRKTPLDIMDRVIQEAQRQGLLILLDSH